MSSYHGPYDSNRRPNLIRTSSLDPSFIRSNLSLVNTPVKLLFNEDHTDLTKNWSEEETSMQRRLVKFDFVRLGPTDYLVKFKPIEKSEFTNNAAIISCIFWEEKELHIVTSVDIILLLEYLIQDSFTIEEKNRVRRNLQSLKPYTVSRSNKNYQRFFQLLMSMEDPRPRNIEKDLKVFKWSDLFKALNKVISKYTTNTATLNVRNDSDTPLPIPNMKTEIKPSDINIASMSESPPKFTNNESFNYSTSQPVATTGPSKIVSPTISSTIPEVQPSIPSAVQPIPTASVSTAPTQKKPTAPPMNFYSSNNNSNSINEQFLPLERLKVMKRKNNLQNVNNNNLHEKHKAYEDGIKPSDPKPLDHNEENIDNTKPYNMEIGSSDSISSTGDSSSTYGLTSTSGDELGDDIKNYADGGSDDVYSQQSSFVEAPLSQPGLTNTPSRSDLQDIKPKGLDLRKQYTPGQDSGFPSFGSGSGSGSASGSTAGSGLFSNAMNGSQNTLATTVGSKKKSKKKKHRHQEKYKDNSQTSSDKDYSNINTFTKDQSNRIFGSVTNQSGTIQQITDHPSSYYQYPDNSQLRTDFTNQVKLPSLEVYFTKAPKSKTNDTIMGSGTIKLPPLVNYTKTNNYPESPNNRLDKNNDRNV